MNKTSNYYDVYRISSILHKIYSIEDDIKSKKETIEFEKECNKTRVRNDKKGDIIVNIKNHKFYVVTDIKNDDSRSYDVKYNLICMWQEIIQKNKKIFSNK